MGIFKPGLLIAGIISFCSLSASAQDDYFASLNYSNLSINRIANVPGITWVTGNSTLDENNQRFFYQGNPTQNIPFHLFTINAVTGATLYSPVCPVDSVGQIFGLEYDNATDTLYSIFFKANAAYFSWIEPATGIVHPIKLLAALTGYTESTFDTKDHLYICNSGTALVIINAANGNILYNSGFAAATGVSDIAYDNTNGKLYGICSTVGLPYPQFDSITLTTGIEHFIANLQPLSLPQINAYTIDESGGKYIFVGADPPSSACINNYLYVIDIPTGATLSKTLYPYAQNVSSITDEDVVAYSYDNLRGKLYVSDWHPPAADNPYINIKASADPICPGDPITFTATAGSTVVAPSYQWFLNGVNIGINSQTYSNSSLQDKDTVYCVMTNHDPCTSIPIDTSNRILIQYSAPVPASVIIATANTTVCVDDNVQFTATPGNGGNTPFYQWQVNGVDFGSNTAIFQDDGLHSGDVVTCTMTSVSNCVVNKTAVSNNLVMQVNSVPSSVTIDASVTTICAGDTVQFTATPVDGGSSPSYQWQVDGNNAGANQPLFISDGLSNGDKVVCIMKGSITCSLPVASLDTITMTVNPVPTIQLEKQVVITRGKSTVLDPSITGNIVNYLWTPGTGLNNPGIPRAIAAPIATTDYQLSVTSDKGCTASGAINVIVYTPLNMPNAFVPNSGQNEIFRIPPSITLTLIRFSVYNRLGMQIFSTADSGRGWDGSFDGHPQPAGVYIWVVEYYDLLSGKRTIDKGSVILIR